MLTCAHELPLRRLQRSGRGPSNCHWRPRRPPARPAKGDLHGVERVTGALGRPHHRARLARARLARAPLWAARLASPPRAVLEQLGVDDDHRLNGQRR